MARVASGFLVRRQSESDFLESLLKTVPILVLEDVTKAIMVVAKVHGARIRKAHVEMIPSRRPEKATEKRLAWQVGGSERDVLHFIALYLDSSVGQGHVLF
jgi:hypothetical protein